MSSRHYAIIDPSKSGQDSAFAFMQATVFTDKRKLLMTTTTTTTTNLRSRILSVVSDAS